MQKYAWKAGVRHPSAPKIETEMETNRRDKTPEGENNNENELPGRKTKRWYETPKINK